jgi:glycosyltransferase involved in cell wall biosynthesis
MKMPLVSIVMPTLNSARFIRETIHSIIEQDYPRFELIVVDGGSTDETIAICEMYLGDGDLKIIRLTAETGSITRSLNQGLAASEGEFIARMDADDIAYPTRLSEQVRFLVSLPEVGMIGSGADYIWGQTGAARSPLWHYDVANMYLVNNPFFHPTVMVRRSLYDDGIFIYDESQTCDEDYELWGRLIPRTKVANIDKSLIQYRIHGNNAQWDPRKHKAKTRAIKGFCDGFGIKNDPLVEALVEFQCSQFIRYESYLVMRDYARKAVETEMPRLGWLHDAIVHEDSYAGFTNWFRRTKGWPI